MFGFGPAATFLIIGLVLLASGIKILPEYERGGYLPTRPLW